jgi:hypothetical protein
MSSAASRVYFCEADRRSVGNCSQPSHAKYSADVVKEVNGVSRRIDRRTDLDCWFGSGRLSRDYPHRGLMHRSLVRKYPRNWPRGSRVCEVARFRPLEDRWP